MGEPEMPFACTVADCGMTFTNEDHLNVHIRKHDMVLQFGCEQKAAVFVADQTPTPTRFIRNCEEVGLFQDLQNVNPFDEGFKRAIETKQGILQLEAACPPSELHTPQMFPLDAADAVFTANNRHNITISRSSSDENGAIKEFETTRISKLTNEVTTISRIVEKHEDSPKTKDSISYTNNIIKIHSNVEIRTDTEENKDGGKNGGQNGGHDKDFDRLQVDVPPIMSQKSIDFVVDSLTTDFVDKNVKNVNDSMIKRIINIKDGARKDNIRNVNVPESIKDVKELAKDGEKKKLDYEVILKLPTGQEIKLVNADKEKPNAKDVLKKVISEKIESQKLLNQVNLLPSIIPTLSSGTLIPVSIVNMPKLPLKVEKKPMRRKSESLNNNGVKRRKSDKDDVTKSKPTVVSDLDSRSAASRRYRAKLKETMAQQSEENKLLKEKNERLSAETAALRALIQRHALSCPAADDIREFQERYNIIEGRN